MTRTPIEPRSVEPLRLPDDQSTPGRGLLRVSLLVFGVSVLVCLPFIILGEDVFVPWLQSLAGRTGWLVAGAVALLSLDAVLPVPSSWVLIFLALEAGTLVGIAGGSLGLCLGVLVASWIGRVAVGKVAPRFVPEAEIARLRVSMTEHTTLTLACMRSIPVLAETSVMIAAAAGVSTTRIFLATLLPNVVVATVYSLAASDSFLTACLAFLATIAVSYAFWRLLNASRKRPSGA